MAVVFSILDLAFIPAGQGAREAYACSVALARKAEELGYRRVWYAEHHNIPTIASSATSVLIAHVAGSRGLPEGRARAPGLPRRPDPRAGGRGHAGQGYARAALHPGVVALRRVVHIYRRDFRPSDQLEAPYVIAGMNVLAADSKAEAEAQFVAVQRSRVRVLIGRGQHWTDDQADEVLESPAGRQVKAMAQYSAVGVAAEVQAYAARFAELARADEIMTVHPAPTAEARLRSIELLASHDPLAP